MYIDKFRAGIVFLFVVSLPVNLVIQAQQAPAINMITAEELKVKMTSNAPVVIVDVRSSEGFANSTTTVKGSFHYTVCSIRPSRTCHAIARSLPTALVPKTKRASRRRRFYKPAASPA
jgi:hypothetical protein